MVSALPAPAVAVVPAPLAAAPRAVLSSIFPPPGEKRLALAVVAVSALAFAVTVPFARVQLAAVPAFIPIYETAPVVSDSLTALLLGQFMQARSRALLVLALGCAFTCLITIPHALTFLGLFAPTGLLGAGSQSTAWLYMFWHGGFALFVIAYAVLQMRDADGNLAPGLNRAGPSNTTVILGGLAVVAAVVLLTALATSGQAALPNIMAGNTYTASMKFVIAVVWGLSALSLYMLWRNPQPTALDLWLMVVMAAWIGDIGLSVVFNAGRFDLGFYAGRIYGLGAASFVLMVLLLETSGLYSRVARANVRLEAQTQKLRADVREGQAAVERTEAQLRQAQKMEAIGNLTGGMAHDFNNLLAIIIGNLDLLAERKNADKDDAELVKSALDAAMRGADLTRRLLAFARRQPLQPQRVNPNELIGETVKLLGRMLGQHIEIITELRADVWPVTVDPAQLASSITNLATNARDAMPNGGSLTIVTGNRTLDADYAEQHAEVTPGDYAMIEISDSGSGMPPDIVARIFEPFFTTKETGKGTGLGLSMVFGFIKQSGGHINVYSELGVGTTFRLYLPRQGIRGRRCGTQDRADHGRTRRARAGRRGQRGAQARRGAAVGRAGLPRAGSAQRGGGDHGTRARGCRPAVHRHHHAGRHQRVRAGAHCRGTVAGDACRLHVRLSRNQAQRQCQHGGGGAPADQTVPQGRSGPRVARRPGRCAGAQRRDEPAHRPIVRKSAPQRCACRAECQAAPSTMRMSRTAASPRTFKAA
jgi:signal transduction histidine kinase